MDFYDTIVHRTVHPNYVLRLWAKHVIRELGMEIDIDELYFIRKEAEKYLSQKKGVFPAELPYEEQIYEMYNRLRNTDILSESVSFEFFEKYVKLADYESEKEVQFLNPDIKKLLPELKRKGIKAFVISDFYTSDEIISKLVSHHGLDSMINGVFVSASVRLSKHMGGIYEYALKETQIDARRTIMIGDNFRSDFEMAEKHGIKSIYVPNKKYKSENKVSTLGSDRVDYLKLAQKTYRACRSSKSPHFSEYILIYSVFIERLYKMARKKGINHLFFLAREGLYLKKLFDDYQKTVGLDPSNFIKTNYLKASRQSALQISFAPLEKEKFLFFKKKYPNVSLFSFLRTLNIESVLIAQIAEETGMEPEETIKGFFHSEQFKQLTLNEKFRNAYEVNRLSQKKAFNDYVDSFGADILKEGIHLVDIGWGGTMQECIHTFFEGKTEVYGYYLGLKEIYNILPETKRYGLIFSVYPYESYQDRVIMANTEIYEQLLSAPHGSAVSYCQGPEYVNEFYDEAERKAFEKYILPIQKSMFEHFKAYVSGTKSICFDKAIVDEMLLKYGLKIGILPGKKRIKTLHAISKGFYDNLGNVKKGDVNYTLDIKKGNKSTRKLIDYIINPEKLILYISRLKLTLITKNRYYFFPSYPIYLYIKSNKWLKDKLLKPRVRLKYSHLK